MRGDLNWLGLSWLGILNASKIEEFVVLLLEELLSELIDSSDSELSSECFNHTLWLNFITSEVVVSNKVLAWLFHSE